MNMLSNLKTIKGKIDSSKRVGRGLGSGKGSSAGKGNKGQKARTGGKVPGWFEGGQTPLVKRMPYIKGFINHNKNIVIAFNFSDLKEILAENKKIDKELLMEKGLISKTKKYDFIKILGIGKIETATVFEGFVYSKKAEDKINKAGGKVS
jgi:large subunit ribosomal protein L15